MRILYDHPTPFFLAHGGLQIQIRQTMAGVRAAGHETEFLRFWEEEAGADVIHYFGRCSGFYIEMARSKGIPVVMSDLLSGTGSRAPWKLTLQAAAIRTARSVLPGFFTNRMGWESYQQAAALVAPTKVEKRLMIRLFGADPHKVHIVTNGVEDFFFRHEPGDRGARLVCTATITERKRVLELAEAAVLAAIPIRIVGRPYSEQDPYYRAFASVARKHPDLVLYDGPVNDRRALARLYQQSAGFVLLSTMESLSLSSMEAAASGCKLLLADLPWARDAFGANAWYCPVPAAVERTAQILKNFVRNLSGVPTPPVPFTWNEIGRQFARIYEGVANPNTAGKSGGGGGGGGGAAS